MVDQECAQQQNSPADPERHAENAAEDRSPNIPYGRGNRPPLPEQQRKSRRGGNYVSSSFHIPGNDARPLTFKSLARHDAVLQSENAQQSGIDNDSRGNG